MSKIDRKFKLSALFGSLLLVVLSILIGSVHAQNEREEVEIVIEHEADYTLPAGVVHQTASEALSADISLTAEQTGQELESVTQAVHFHFAFNDWVEGILSTYSDQISRLYVDRAPDTSGYLQFVGDVPQEVLSSLAQADTLNALGAVHLSGNGLISLEDQYTRASLAMEALVNYGYQNAVTFYDPVENKVRIELYIPTPVNHPDEELIVQLVRAWIVTNPQGQLSEGRATDVESTDLDIYVYDEVLEFEHYSSRGGDWLQSSSFVDTCTSGFSVSGVGGDGIVTAAHCDYDSYGNTAPLGYLDHQPADDNVVHGMTWKDREFDLDGDVSWYTTTGIELAEFYSSSSSIRDVNNVRQTNMMVNNYVCTYGRFSNIQDCSHIVEAVNVQLTASGVTTGNHARTHKVTNTFGDSGGPYFYGTSAWGILSGASGGKTYFTTAEETESVLNITIKTK